MAKGTVTLAGEAEAQSITGNTTITGIGLEFYEGSGICNIIQLHQMVFEVIPDYKYC